MTLFKRIFLITLSFFYLEAYAALDLEVTQGMDTAIPIAIVPFAHERSMGIGAFSEVIRNDLNHSGQFKLVHSGPASQQVSVQSFSQWRDMGADHLVFGEVNESKSVPGEYEITFKLVNLFDATANKEGTVLLRKSYTLSKANGRALAHHISDLIYQKLLGKPGVFSTHIAYILVKEQHKKLQYQLMVADIDGYNQQALVISEEPIMSPAWSPDGKKIAYVSFESRKPAIYIQTMATGKRTKLTSYDGINGAPTWSPKGDKLAMVLSTSGYPKIYQLDLATQQLTQMTTGWAIDTEPSYSPDGKSLIFTSNMGGGPQIYQIPVTGGRAQRLTFEGPYNATGSFTRDGKSLVLLHKENNAYNIGVQDLSSGRLELLTQGGEDQSPSLAPNDEMIVFASKFGTKQVLGMVSRDAKIRIRLPAPEGDVREPAWSPA